MIAGRGGIGRFMRQQRKEEKEREKKMGYDIDPELEGKIGEVRLKDLQRKYMLFDADGTGMIDATELGDVLRAVGLNPIESRVLELLEEYDSDKSGTLSFSEFVELWSDELLDAEDDELMFQRAFQFFDKDGNGDISLDEFKEVLTELGDPLKESELNLFFRLVDKNGDGRLQYDEFLGFLRGEREVDADEDVGQALAAGGDDDDGGGGGGVETTGRISMSGASGASGGGGGGGGGGGAVAAREEEAAAAAPPGQPDSTPAPSELSAPATEEDAEPAAAAKAEEDDVVAEAEKAVGA